MALCQFIFVRMYVSRNEIWMRFDFLAYGENKGGCMSRDFIGNLRVLAAVGGNSVTKQNLELLREKYSLTDTEFEQMIDYCSERSIMIYDEVEACRERDAKTAALLAELNSMPRRKLTEEEKELRRLAEDVAYEIIRLGKNRTINRTSERVCFCGTYMNSLQKSVYRYVKQVFSLEELRFIINHLPENSGMEEHFTLQVQNPQEQEMCRELNPKLNGFIPRVREWRTLMELFAD